MISDARSKKPQFGEIFITNDEVNGSLESLKHFRGRLITNACGGYKKLFIIEESYSNEGLVSSLHAPEYDDYDQTFAEEAKSVKNLEDIFQAFNDKGQIKKMVCGKKHTVFITEEGKIYSYGIGEYGSLGHGGLIYSDIPKNIIKFNQKKIIQITCGEFHTLALTDTYDLYSWGRGFEGQLGTGKDCASFPCYVSIFYQKYDYENKKDQKKIVKYIACGAYHSLAISDDGILYAWGEARLGQTGNGKSKSEKYPKIVNFGNNLKEENILEDKIICVSGGYGHSAAVLESGELYTWGLNFNGQLGHGSIKSSYFPQKVVKDILGNNIPLFKTVQCGYNNTFAIDINGQLWSWGGGNLGHKNNHFQDLPRKITQNTQNRKFSEIHATSNSAVFFAPMRIMSVRPNYGPSCGGTLISLLGTGFTETGKQGLRFQFKNYKIEIALNYDHQTESFYCQTPKFDDISEEVIQWPLISQLEVTLDGKIYTECEESFLIYSSKIQMTSIEPKCASVEGGTLLALNINIDDLTASYLKYLTVGFQQRLRKDTINIQQNSTKNKKNSLQKIINPLDLDISDPELEKENWVCVQGEYDKGKITCEVPKLADYNSESLNFNVDVSLNGQQFTGQPSSFRFYDIQIHKLEPNNDALSGGATSKLMGEGFFDTLTKKIMFKSIYGERLIDINWDKKERTFSFIVPPITWLLGGQDPSPELIKQVQNGQIQVFLTLNSIQWIKVSNFLYAEAQITRIGPVPEWEKGMNEEAIKLKWNNAEEIVDPLKGLSSDAEIKKKMMNQIKYQILKFMKSTVVKGVYKNSQKIGVIIPELDQVPQGIFDIGIEISYNGQCFSSSGKTFRYMSFGKDLPLEQRAKWEDGELKNIKKSAPKPPK
ncbi:rcc1 family hect domain protein, putative [Ichthyophthirius multifiliis]|uniref:Rcc1 family hect domain protein, putative n=1 Tax=Ichthyophthirius multifiliis TaxID=5932 RepID=G0QZF5_ICHMU|nr:rcc1 family hect domain protein, putative [Ichthyophthirius multifiliis]EGR29393.1 rcc1 family hect domain protein, putative [Ichthyophthirius multifiliis]|eukprot:XP_004030629.1 rcc1 family hect domain protein, putative [Ichthyophthirius multifiliis]